MLSKVFDKILHDDEDSVDNVEKKDSFPKKQKAKSPVNYLELLLIFALALIPRLLYIYIFSNPNFPGWYTDVFHHWQIAYLSKEVGFSHGFLRLWDFKGMEFFWGLLHPLALVIVFWLTGTTHILTARLLSTFGGSISILLLFLLIKRHFNRRSAWAVAVFASFFPITLFSNTVGMQEELAMPFILGGILLWPAQPVLTGIFFALASMVRAEYWLFCVGLVLGSFLLRKNTDRAVILLFSYFLPILVYMKYLANYTNNYIYPIYWNFLASVKGDWFADLPVIGVKLLAKRISQGIFLFGLAGLVITLIRRPRASLLFLFGFGNILFIGFMVGFGAYVKGYIDRFWVDRLYNWPYLFTAILLILLMMYYLPRKLPRLGFVFQVFGWLILVSGLALSQFLWLPINHFMEPVEAIYNDEKSWADEIAKAYTGGVVLLPEDRPYITYFLVQDHGISGKQMQGQMFDPFFYFDNREAPFDNWGEDREIIIDWLRNDNIRLIALTSPKPTYLGLIEREPQLFTKIPSDRILLYEFHAQ